MRLWKKQSDPISERASALSAEIASLEGQIKQLTAALEQSKIHPPPARSARLPETGAPPPAAAAPSEPIFEDIDTQAVKSAPQPVSTPGHFNDQGIRKFDFPAAWQRFKNLFRPPPPSNPKLVSFLAAGSIQGLRPLRYEKRIARNRFIVLVIIFSVILWGLVTIFLQRH